MLRVRGLGISRNLGERCGTRVPTLAKVGVEGSNPFTRSKILRASIILDRADLIAEKSVCSSRDLKFRKLGMKAYFFAAALLVSTAFTDARAMSYGLITLADGSPAIVAQGRIEGNETARLLAVIQASSAGMPRTLFVSSPGGNMASALHLGQTVRQLGLRTSVGRIAINSSGQPVVTSGVCGSACVYVLMGGVSRTMRPGSLIGVHSPEFALVASGRRYIVDPATSHYLTRSSEPFLRSYARRMGVSPTLITVAHGVPHDSGRILTPSEINRYGLVNGRTQRVAAPRRAATRQRQVGRY